MEEKQKLIIDYLKEQNGIGYYIEIRDSMSLKFDDEEDFDKALYQLKKMGVIEEIDNSTLYKLVINLIMCFIS